MTTPSIKPIKIPEFESKQSKYQFSGNLPTRSLILAPSGGGKTVLLQNMILDIYKDCFSRIYIFSPSFDVDIAWKPMKVYLKNVLKQDEKKETHFSTPTSQVSCENHSEPTKHQRVPEAEQDEESFSDTHYYR